MKKALSCFWKYWPFALAAVLALIGECVCDLLQPTLMARMIDVGVGQGDLALVLRYALTMLGVTALGMALAVARSMFSSLASQRYGRDLRLTLYQKIQRMPLDDVDQLERASLITRLTNDVTQIQTFVNGSMRIFLRAPILCTGAIVMAFRLSHRMALSLAVAVPVSLLMVALSIVVGYPHFYKVQVLLDKLGAVVREYLSGVRVVKAFGRFDYEQARFEQMNEGLSDASTSAMRVTSAFGPAASLAVNLGIAAVVVLGGFAREEQGNVVAFVNYMIQIMVSLAMFSRIFNQLARALVSGWRVAEVLSGGDDMVPTGPTQAMKDAGRVTLTFEDVSFAYKGSPMPALTGLSFEATTGETVGVIGSTGSGKTTLANLIVRFYDVCGGRIMLNGVDVRSLDVRSLRERVAVVAQQSLLFSGTVEDNLRWGNPDESLDMLWAALEAAQASNFVRGLPEGLDTWLGQAGVNLSGGQKQRLSIARALVKSPVVLILDDCTSAVDVTTEAKIRSALSARAGGMLTIAISQRIASVMSADRILVLDEGRVAMQGTHEALLRDCEIYRAIYHSQIGEEAANVG